jgi:ubiquinone biosynthesis protein UbiJ
MNKAMKYLTPKKPISKIARDRAEEMEERNAIAGLFEELAALEQSNAELKARVEMLEKGGKQK